MAFCTSCGANVTGAFCNQCGTPAAAAAAQQPAAAAMPQPASAMPGALPPPMPGARRGLSPLVWVLIIIGGLFVLGIIGVIGTGMFVMHKARQAGLSTELMRRNPAAAVARMMVAANKDVDLVSEDDNAGTLTVRDRKTGKTMTMNFDQAKNGKFSFSAEGDDGKTATMEFGAGAAGKLPSWVPSYPGATAEGTFSVKGESNDGKGEGGNVTFTTTDAASKVMSFYQDKAKELGMKVNLTTTGDNAGMIVATDESKDRSLTVIIGGDSGKTTANVTYGSKK